MFTLARPIDVYAGEATKILGSADSHFYRFYRFYRFSNRRAQYYRMTVITKVTDATGVCHWTGGASITPHASLK